MNEFSEYDYLMEHPHEPEAWNDWLGAVADGLALDDYDDRWNLAQRIAGVLVRYKSR